MKKDLHPNNYRVVIFEDLNEGTRFLTRSTVTAEETAKWEDGNEYPVVKVHISSASHPFFTGQEKLIDIEGRVDKFKARRDAAEKALEARKAAAKKKVDHKTHKDEQKQAKVENQTKSTTDTAKAAASATKEKQEATADK